MRKTEMRQLRVAQFKGWYDSTWYEYEQADVDDVVSALLHDEADQVILITKCEHSRLKPHRIDPKLSPSDASNHCEGSTRKVFRR